jgi:hypothetical protein
MTQVSADTLFHFTPTINKLMNILEKRFLPHYSLEDFSLIPSQVPNAPPFKLAIPMVCFCDLPLSQTQTHSAIYGDYCIGLSKSWGLRQGVSPVLYYHQNSGMYQNLKTILETYLNDHQSTNFNNKLFNDLLYSLCFLKPYEGSREIKGKKTTIRFYNEREWRFVPQLHGDFYNFALTENKFRDANCLKKQQDLIWSCCNLRFEPTDINYIIVQNNGEISPIRDKMKVLFNTDLMIPIFTSEKSYADF